MSSFGAIDTRSKADICDEFFVATERAAENNDPNFFSDVLNKAISSQLLGVDEVGLWALMSFKESYCVGSFKSVAGWLNIVGIVKEHYLDDNLMITLEDEDREFFSRVLGAEAVELVYDYDTAKQKFPPENGR